jgi:hypothetical protein
VALNEFTFTEPEPEQPSTSMVWYEAVPFSVQLLAPPSNPEFTSMFHELFARHLQVPAPSQYLLLPHAVFCAALLPPPQVPFDWHISLTLQTLPSSHGPVLTACAGQPLAGTQVLTV